MINNPSKFLETYSMSEEVIGTWIDGRPLYRVTMTGITPDTVATTKIYSVPWKDMDDLVNFSGYIHGSSNYPIVRLPFHRTTVVESWVSSTSLCIILSQELGINYTNRNFCVTVEYTKTTDTALIDPTAITTSYEEGVNES